MDNQQDNQGGRPADAGAAEAKTTDSDRAGRRPMRSERLRIEVLSWLEWRWSCR